MTDNSERHRRVRDVFDDALRVDAADRDAYLAVACAGDAELQRQVARLLASHGEAASFLERPVSEIAAFTQADGSSGDLEIADGDEPVPPGAMVGPYRIVERLARGGMGSVYRATDIRLQRDVALKLMARTAHEAERVDRFLHEARATASLDHPNVVRAYDVGVWDGRPYLITELLEGVTLRERLEAGTIAVDETCRIARGLAHGLAAAHAAGLVHRDLKPENVFLTQAGVPKVLDFGVAKLAEDDIRRAGPSTRAGTLFGTVGYLAPEQIAGGAVDGRADLFALGAVIFEMLAGRRPFARDHVIDELYATLHDPVPDVVTRRPDVPAGLAAIVVRLLEKSPEARVPDAASLEADLADVEGGAGSGRVLRRRDRRTLLVAAGVVAVAAVALFVVPRVRRPAALTERDTVLIADFVNSTSDPIFDGTLGQALAIDLGQTPFLRIVSRERVRQTLAFMTRSPDERVAGAVAREVCQRLGATVIVNGSIAAVGTRYLVALEAVKCQTGDTIASQRADADGRDLVLRALDTATARLRQGLGEAHNTLGRFATPIEEATTSSLEALKAYQVGEETRARTGDRAALPFFERAIQLDPDFAMAYARMSAMARNLGRFDDAGRLAREAYARRSRASEPERLYIDGRHCETADSPDECARDIYELWKRTYPRDGLPYNNLCVTYDSLGRFEEALANCLEAVRLDPDDVISYGNLIENHVLRGRLADAVEVAERAIARKLDDPDIHLQRFDLAYALGTRPQMTAEQLWAAGRPEESQFIARDAEILASAGRFAEARGVRSRAESIASGRYKPDVARIRARGALFDAAVGATAEVRAALATIDEVPSSAAMLDAAMAAVLIGDRPRARRLLQLPRTGIPQRAVAALEAAGALLDIDAGDRSALGRVPPPAGGDLIPSGPALRPIYIRGLAYLHARAAAQAVEEFQRIVDHPGCAPTSPLHALARVQQARAFTLTGDRSRARQAYEEFVTLWKDADPDVPLLQAARAEYAALGRADTPHP